MFLTLWHFRDPPSGPAMLLGVRRDEKVTSSLYPFLLTFRASSGERLITSTIWLLKSGFIFYQIAEFYSSSSRKMKSFLVPRILSVIPLKGVTFLKISLIISMEIWKYRIKVIFNIFNNQYDTVFTKSEWIWLHSTSLALWAEYPKIRS